jgi:hypothetical protein
MNRNSYVATSRYNELGISALMIELVHRMYDVGLVDLWRGSESAGMVSRIWPTNRLAAIFNRSPLNPLEVTHSPSEECVVLNSTSGKPLEYEDTAQTASIRAKITAYNSLMEETFVDIPTLETPAFEYVSRHGDRRAVRLDQFNKFTRFTFYRGSFELGGQPHGGFWQQLNKAGRSSLHLNDNPVIEDDYSGLHLTLIYGLEGARLRGDPYDLSFSSQYTRQQLRAWTKSLALMAINAKSEEKAFQAFRNDQPTGSAAKRFRNSDLKTILDAFRAKHPVVKSYLGSDAGVRLMNIEGKIALRVIDYFTRRRIPVLTVFDSYLIDIYHTIDLRRLMMQSIEAEVPGLSHATTRSGVGYDQVMGLRRFAPHEAYDRLGSIPNPVRTAGYINRLADFRGWLE